jgi:hypothetical protein
LFAFLYRATIHLTIILLLLQSIISSFVWAGKITEPALSFVGHSYINKDGWEITLLVHHPKKAVNLA